MLSFYFLEYDLRITSPPHFAYDFPRKKFLMLYSNNWWNFIFWLSALLKILGDMCIAIVYLPRSDVINFEINFTLLMKPFFYMIKKSIQGERKSIFHHFWCVFSSQKLSQALECAFNCNIMFKNTKNYH